MVLVDPVEVSDEVTTVAATPEPQQTTPAPQPDDGLPEKFKGKTAAEIAKAYLAAESELGRARNELGTSRRVIDELLELRPRPTEKSEPVARPVTPYDLAENPEETITAIARREADQRASQAEQKLQRLEANLNAQQFEKKHPGYVNTLQSAEFQNWVAQKPLRVNLVQKAGQGDWDAGDEVLNLYQEYNAAKAAVAPAQAQATEAAKQAGLAKSGGSGANKVVQGGDGKKIYKRTELAEMYIHRPEEYARLSDSGELGRAYAEKRVR
jgi:hypothetical protein